MFTLSKLQISISCWSPCGKYLAASSKAGDILVFDVRTRAITFAFQHEKKAQICNLVWNPSPGSQSSKEIAFCDSRGYLGLLENVTGGGQPQQPSAESTAQSTSNDNDVPMMGDDDDYFGDDAEISISQIKKDTGFVQEDGRDVFTGARPSLLGNKLFFKNY